MNKKNQNLICTTCGTIGNIKRQARGKMWLEIVLWFCYIIPGVIYSLWRTSNYRNVCQTCKGEQFVPIDSPMGKFIQEQGKI